MSRTLAMTQILVILLSILTLVAVPLTSVAVNAGEKEDREAIRALFHQEQEGHRLGNEKNWRIQDGAF